MNDVAPGQGRAQRAGNALSVGLLATCLVSAALLARRNLRLGRGDRRGASRVAWAVFTVFLVRITLEADHVPSLGRECMCCTWDWSPISASCGRSC
jgi:hypothetical protein